MIVIIPARLNSTRLPRKLVQDLGGISVIQRTYENVLKAKPERVIVAVDDDEMAEHCEQFGAEIVMTSPSHESGTLRLAEVVSKLALADDEIVVNVQGDEPFMPHEYIEKCYDTLARCNAKISTLAHKNNDGAENANIVKVVFDKFYNALYFSRSNIPFNRDGKSTASFYHHLGIYAYRVEFLNLIEKLSEPEIEVAEKLEQLRFLWHGYQIKVGIVNKVPIKGIDTEIDLENARVYLKD